MGVAASEAAHGGIAVNGVHGVAASEGEEPMGTVGAGGKHVTPGRIVVNVYHNSDDVYCVTVERNQHPPDRSGSSTKS